MNYTEKKYHNNEVQRRGFFSYHAANLRRAQAIAEQLEMGEEDMYLTIARSIAADDCGSYQEEERLLLLLLEKARSYGSPAYESKAYVLLSSVADKTGQAAEAREWARKAAKVWQRGGELSGDGYFQLGEAAYRQGDLKTAMTYFEQALTLW